MRSCQHWFGIAAIFTSMTGVAVAAPTVMPFRLQGHLIVIKGSIGGLDDLNMVVDTGASSTVISRWVSKALRLKTRRAEIFAFGESVEIDESVLPEIAFGPLSFDSVVVKIAKLPSSGGLRIDALVGLDLLKSRNLTIDYETRQLTFGESCRLGDSLGFYPAAHILLMSMRVGGQQIGLVLDTGAGHLFLFAEKVQNLEGLRRTGVRKRLRHVGGGGKLIEVTLKEISLGRRTWRSATAYLTDTSEGYRGTAGILGPLALGLKRLHLDFENSRISWD